MKTSLLLAGWFSTGLSFLTSCARANLPMVTAHEPALGTCFWVSLQAQVLKLPPLTVSLSGPPPKIHRASHKRLHLAGKEQ